MSDRLSSQCTTQNTLSRVNPKKEGESNSPNKVPESFEASKVKIRPHVITVTSIVASPCLLRQRPKFGVEVRSIVVAQSGRRACEDNEA